MRAAVPRPQLGARAAYAKQAIRDKLIDHKHCICQHGEDMPEVKDWRWAGRRTGARTGYGETGASETSADNV